MPGFGCVLKGSVYVPAVIPTADAAHPNKRTRDCKVRALTVRFLRLLVLFFQVGMFVGKETMCQKSTPVLGINL